MAISTFRLPVLFLIVFCVWSTVSFAAAINSLRTGNWNDPGTWSTGSVPTAADDIIIQQGHIVTINANAICRSLNMKENVVILATYSLTITGDATIDQSILGVNSGYVYVGGVMNVIGNGNANKGVLSVSTGSVIVVGSIYFYKDQIGITNGSDIYRLLDISGTGTIDLGGTLIGDNGTDAATLARTTPNSFIFKGGIVGNYWNESGNWETNTVPGAANSVIIPLGLTANLQQDQFVRQINMAPGAWINLGAKTLTLSANLNNIGGNFSGSGILRFDGTGIDQTYTGCLPVTLVNVEISKAGKTLFLNGPFQVSGLVNVTGGTVNSNGYLRLISSATQSAGVAPLLNGAMVTGNVNVESWFTGGEINKRGTRMVSAPIDDNSTIAGNKVYQQLKKYIIITGPGGVANGFDPGNAVQPFAITLTQYTEANTLNQLQFISIPRLNGAVVPIVKPGEGFFLFYRGNRNSYTPGTSFTSNKVNPTFAVPESLAITYFGFLNQGNIPLTLSKANNPGDTNDGYNVIGNPYAASIDFKTLYLNNSSAIENQYMIVKPDKSGTLTYASDGSNGIVINGGTIASSAALARYIQPGQALYIKKTISGTTTYPAFFNENCKAATSSPARLLSLPETKNLLQATNMSMSPVISESYPSLKILRMNLQDAFNMDETAVIFKHGSITEYEGRDAAYFTGSTVSLSTLSSDDKSLAINFMPDLKDVQEIKLNLNASASGPLKLSFTDLSAADGFQIFLKDALFPDNLINVKINPVYDFSLDKANPESFGNSRFKLIFKPEPVSAPVIFTAKKIRSAVSLNWSGELARDVQYFEVEVSLDNLLYKNIGMVTSTGTADLNSAYAFIDKVPSSNVNFYRLKQFNKNGSITYSELRTIDLSVSKEIKDPVIMVYPNPSADKIQVELNGQFDYDIQASVYNLHGKKLKGINFTSAVEISLEVSDLPKGIYILELRKSENQKVIGRSKFGVGI